MTGPAPTCGVVGRPVAHSLSPALHRAAYQSLGLSWVYDAHEVPAGGLASFVAALPSHWRGLSVTMPLKHEALALADVAGSSTAVVGVANTLVREPGDTEDPGAADGAVVPRWRAENTDVGGVVAALRAHGVEPAPSVQVWGAGATAASVLVAVAQWSPTAAVTVRARSANRAADTLAVARRAGLHPELVAWDAPLPGADTLVVSTVPIAAQPDLGAAVSAAGARAGTLFDVLYDPWPTPLTQAWTSAGGTAIGGLELLLHQAARQVRLITGRDVDVEVLRAAADRELAARGDRR